MKKREGLTLIEVIISLAIVGIIAMVFLSTFSSGIKNIFKTRDTTKTVYKVQEDIDARIEEVEAELELEEKTSLATPIKVKINDEKIEVDGKLIKVEKDGIIITTFVPDKSQVKLEDD